MSVVRSGLLWSRRAAVLTAVASIAACRTRHRGDALADEPPPSVFPDPDQALTTDELFPQASTYVFEQGQAGQLHRITGPSVELGSGRVAFIDPGYLPVTTAPPAVTLAAGSHPTELWALRFEGGPETGSRGCVVALGEIGDAVVWRILRDDHDQPYYLGVDAGMGCVYDADRLDELTDAVEPFQQLVDDVLSQSIVGLRIGTTTGAAVFDCGMGDGGYPVYVGSDRDGRAVAVAADLELHHHAVRTT